MYDALLDDFEDDAGGAPGTDPGEIVVRGPNLFLGYWPDRSDGPDGDGWWSTGDVAYADEDGDLFLVDRLGDLILVSGFNVYPQEVEQVLVAHPRVADAAVVGPTVDGILLVVRIEGSSRDGTTRALELLEQARGRVLGAIATRCKD